MIVISGFLGVVTCLPIAARPTPEELRLRGEDAIIFPEHGLPYIQSHRIVNHGEIHEDGSCSFRLESFGSPNPLAPYERWITTQLGWDPVACIEVLEIGVVDDRLPGVELLD